MHSTEDPGLSLRAEEVQIVTELKAVLLAIPQRITSRAAAKLAFGAVPVEATALEGRVGARGLTHWIGRAGSAVSTLLALQIAHFIDNNG